MNIKIQDQKFIVESNNKTFIVPFISNVVLVDDKEYCVPEMTWDKEPSKLALELIERLSESKQETKKK